MKIEKDAVTFEMPDADFVAKFGMQAAADMVLDPVRRPAAGGVSLYQQAEAPLLCAAHGGSISPRHHPQA